jgi:hypothetical protein
LKEKWNKNERQLRDLEAELNQEEKNAIDEQWKKTCSRYRKN